MCHVSHIAPGCLHFWHGFNCILINLHQEFGTPLRKFVFFTFFLLVLISFLFFLCSHLSLHSLTISLAISSRSALIISSTSFVSVLLLIIINCLNVPLHN